MATLVLLLAHAGTAAAQAIASPDYVGYLPRATISAVGQTEASARFQLFGDRAAPGYVDRSPKNGIDDRRDALFARLGEDFAPWMVRNTYGFPTDIGRLLRERDVPLVVDRFDLSRHGPRRLSSDTIRLGRGLRAGGADADARLRDLLVRLGPQATRAAGSVSPDADPHEVLYLDMPGDDPRSWAREYGGRNGFDVSPNYVGYAKTYVHPFLTRAANGPDGAARYEFVLQYWFYYPTNDAGNVHEGDFEHVNVFVAPRATVRDALDSTTVARLLDGSLDPRDLVARRIDYYFHYWVFPVDFSRPNAYLPHSEWRREVDSLPESRVGERRIWERLRRRAYLDEAETVVNRHPLVLIGGDGRGLNLLMRPPGSLGLSTHGSYPFPGLYKATGPAGTGESIDHDTDLHRRAPAADAPETEPMIRYDNPARLEVLPDWERLAPLALEDPEVRWKWAWFLLPLRVGYPATVSPLAGIIRYADTGNVPPGPPSYSGGWNRIADGAGFALYLPHSLSSLTPYDVQDTYNARWGYLNATLPTWSLLPPLDLVYRLVLKPLGAAFGRSLPTYSRSEDLPARRIGVGLGASRFVPSEDFARLIGFPELATPIIQRANAVTGTPLQGYGLSPASFEPLVSWRAEIDLHLGNRFVTTNGISHGTSRLSQSVVFADHPEEPIRADLDFWEYVGSLRWNLAMRRVQPFVDVGYGLSWYRLADLEAFGENLGSSRWVRKPGFWHDLLPNTWHFGGGLEVLPRYGFGRVNLGAKAAAGLYFHDLGLSTDDATTVFFQNTRIRRWKIDLTGTVAY